MNNYNEQPWLSLPNPFTVSSAPGAATVGHVSGRFSEIAEIISSTQSAFLLTGSPGIGKTTLVRYLQDRPETAWSWRDELSSDLERVKLDSVHFVSIDLGRLEGTHNAEELYRAFVKQCIAVVQAMYQPDKQPADTVRALREILREVREGRCFVMLDNLDSLGRASTWFTAESKAKTFQERGLALLDHCGAIRLLVDLIDEFSSFGLILVLESLARTSLGAQFSHVSADLARLAAQTLQVFRWDDTCQFLAQTPEAFGPRWSETFARLGGQRIFSADEQQLIMEQAGSHPYLLQQYSFYHFRLKRAYAHDHNTWVETLAGDKGRISEWINGRLSPFLQRMWQRLQETVKADAGTRALLFDFVRSLNGHSSSDLFSLDQWTSLGTEVRYILQNEGLVRSEPMRPVYYPGAILRDYLLQRVREQSGFAVAAVREARTLPAQALAGGGRGLSIQAADGQAQFLPLSEIEYNLFKTLLQHADQCTEEVLMETAWGHQVARSVFTQRLHRLRKKLKDTMGTEMIENRYGGIYLLKHPEWFRLRRND